MDTSCDAKRQPVFAGYRNPPTMEFAGRPFDGELPLTKLSGPQGELELRYDAAGRLTECVDARISDDGSSNTTAMVHRRGVRVRDDGQSRGRRRRSVAGTVQRHRPVLDAQDALGGIWSYEYDAFHRIMKQTDPGATVFRSAMTRSDGASPRAGQDGLWAGTIEYSPR